jgi:hypothetical protein
MYKVWTPCPGIPQALARQRSWEHLIAIYCDWRENDIDCVMICSNYNRFKDFVKKLDEDGIHDYEVIKVVTLIE